MEPQYKKDIGNLEQVNWTATKVVGVSLRWLDSPSEKRPKELGLFSLEKRWQKPARVYGQVINKM